MIIAIFYAEVIFMRNHKSVWTNSTKSIILSVLIGLLFIFFTALLLSVVMYYILGDMRVAKIFSIFSVCLGTYMSTYLCGKFRRKHGLIDGIISALLIYIVIMVLGIIFFRQFIGIKKLLLLTVSGSIGGVAGVNSKRPKNFTE